MLQIDRIIESAQPGLLYNPPHGVFVIIGLNDHGGKARECVLDAVRRLNDAAADMEEKTKIVVGFSPALWAKWQGNDMPGAPPEDSILDRLGRLRNTGGDVWFYLKSASEANCETLLSQIGSEFGELIGDLKETRAWQRTDGKILDDHFYDGITSPTDPVGVGSFILRDGDGGCVGSCWGFTQAFVFDWNRYGAMNVDDRVDVIGRNFDGAIVPDDDMRSHIQRARVYDANRSNRKLLRESLPFGESDTAKGRERGIYFVAFAQDAGVVEQILHSMSGDGSGSATDKLLDLVQGESGGYWYIPSAVELGLAQRLEIGEFDLASHWAVRSSNGLMFYNSNDYLYTMGTGKYAPGDPPSNRILYLLSNICSRWRDNWYQLRDIPRIAHLRTFLDEGEENIMQASVAIRKGMAIKKSLTRVHTHSEYPQTPDMYAWRADQFRIDPKDILFGVMPELSLGRGKEVMPYLRDDEQIKSFLLSLDESAAMGHVVPDHRVVLEKGIGRLIAELTTLREGAKDGAQRDFYASAVYALEGVQGYCQNYVLLAERMAADTPESRVWERDNLLQLAARARKLATDAPDTFLEAVQTVFLLHCCLHLIGNPVAVGRLDQLLIDFYEKDAIGEEEAQEIIDAFWIKLDEKAIHNRHHVTDHVSYGTTAVSYAGGNFPQGGGINQWVQQVTVGGYLPTDDPEPEPGCNAVTLMCLRAARRLPLNAPCLSLRVYPGMPDEIVEEAAKSILSGGAHPILFQEARMVKGLHAFSGFPLHIARNYACDGCYEPMIAGATEFAFSNVAPLDALELSLNQGATYGQAGPVYLRGLKTTFRSPHARDIASFEQLQEIYLKHLEWLIVQFFNSVLSNYGNVNKICPSPLLSTMIDGCVEAGRDISNGGARYHLIAPMFVGMSTTIDSLYAIKKLVFDEETASTTLPELLDCLKSDWGCDLKEPWQSDLAGPERAALRRKRYAQLRVKALGFSKFGTGNAEVDALGGWLVEHMCRIAKRVLEHPPEGFKETLEGIVQKYSLPGRPFVFHLAPGTGTFEGYVGDGLGSGASADGRRNGQPYPSDFSPAVVPQDLPPIPQDRSAEQPVPDTYREIYTSMSSWNQDPINHLVSNAAPVDLNIPEDFPLDDLVTFIKRYIGGEVGSNLITITCANPDTYRQAADAPERFEFVRVRMGGWSEFFAAMFPEHQKQHQRRPFFVPGHPEA